MEPQDEIHKKLTEALSQNQRLHIATANLRAGREADDLCYDDRWVLTEEGEQLADETLRRDVLAAASRSTCSNPDCGPLCPTCGDPRDTGILGPR